MEFRCLACMKYREKEEPLSEGLGGSKILWTLWQSQPGLCFSGLDVAVPADLPGHKAVQVLQPRAHRMWCVWQSWGQTQDWKDQWAGEQWAQDHVVLPGGKQTWLPSMKIRLNILLAYHWECHASLGRQKCRQSLVFVHWNIRLFLAFLWWPAQVTELWYSVLHHRLPPKRLLAELSTGCCFPVQLAQGASHLDLCKMMKEKSVVVRDMSEGRGCNHLPCIV